MSQYIDAIRKSLPGSDHLILDGVEQTDRGIAVRVRARHLPVCPACGDNRISFHSRYQRRLRDLPWQGRCVQLLFQTRRFRCRNSACARKVFAERLPEVASPRARETTRLCDIAGLAGYAMGGLPGARLLNRLGIPGSDDLVLRRIKAKAAKQERKVRVLGVEQRLTLRDDVDGSGEGSRNRSAAGPIRRKLRQLAGRAPGVSFP